MKFAAFWEYDPKDLDAIVEKFKARTDPGYKILFGPFAIGGQSKGCTIFETDNPDHLTEYSVYYQPELRVKIYPIEMSVKAIEIMDKMKK
jgi:hypothetical protein